MAKVQRTASKLAWSVKRQAAFGTRCDGTDLTKFVKLADPITIVEDVSMWSDKGMIGLGHNWETQRGIQRSMVKLEIPVQPLSIDFMGYLLAAAFNVVSTVDNTNYYTHTTKFSPLATTPEMLPFSLTIEEDGNDKSVIDCTITSLTIRGSGDGRIEMGASIVASQLATDLAGFTNPTAEDARYIYNYAGTATSTLLGDIKAQLRSWELTIDTGVDVDGSFRGTTTEALRRYPQVWTRTGAESMGLTYSVEAESGDLATLRAAKSAATAEATTIACQGLVIGATAGYDLLTVSVPVGVIDDVSESYENGVQVLGVTVGGQYQAAATGPLTVAVVNDEASYFAADS